jgi:hypothetical protein
VHRLFWFDARKGALRPTYRVKAAETGRRGRLGVKRLIEFPLEDGTSMAVEGDEPGTEGMVGRRGPAK